MLANLATRCTRSNTFATPMPGLDSPILSQASKVQKRPWSRDSTVVRNVESRQHAMDNDRDATAEAIAAIVTVDTAPAGESGEEAVAEAEF